MKVTLCQYHYLLAMTLYFIDKTRARTQTQHKWLKQSFNDIAWIYEYEYVIPLVCLDKPLVIMCCLRWFLHCAVCY